VFGVRLGPEGQAGSVQFTFPVPLTLAPSPTEWRCAYVLHEARTPGLSIELNVNGVAGPATPVFEKPSAKG
jgi:hypothetical protein